MRTTNFSRALGAGIRSTLHKTTGCKRRLRRCRYKCQDVDCPEGPRSQEPCTSQRPVPQDSILCTKIPSAHLMKIWTPRAEKVKPNTQVFRVEGVHCGFMFWVQGNSTPDSEYSTRHPEQNSRTILQFCP